MDGFSLIEVLVALSLLGTGLLAVAPMFIYGQRKAAASADFGRVGAAAVKRLEALRATAFASLPQGGDLTTNLTSYSDTTDPSVIVRWTITNDQTPVTTSKTIIVLALARRQLWGPVKTVQIFTKRSR